MSIVDMSRRMNVRLLSYSRAAEPTEDTSDIQELVAYCARVSNPSNQNNTATNGRLLSYLMKHKHWSPFEMVNLCLEIECTRDIGRQILRHRSFSFQEFSQRYANPQDIDNSFVVREARLQDPKNRQNSIPIDVNLEGDLAVAFVNEWRARQEQVISLALDTYKWAIENGIAKEQARAVLPEGNTMSRMYVNGTLRSWIHYVELRRENGTQQEHIEIAKACAEVIASVFPLINEE